MRLDLLNVGMEICICLIGRFILLFSFDFFRLCDCIALEQQAGYKCALAFSLWTDERSRREFCPKIKEISQIQDKCSFFCGRLEKTAVYVGLGLLEAFRHLDVLTKSSSRGQDELFERNHGCVAVATSIPALKAYGWFAICTGQQAWWAYNSSKFSWRFFAHWWIPHTDAYSLLPCKGSTIQI